MSGYKVPRNAYEILSENPGISGAELARRIGRPERTASRYARHFKAGRAIPSDENVALFSVPTYVYVGEKHEAAVPSYTGHLQLEGDCLIINDVHIPATDWEFADLAVQIAEQHLPEPRTLIIAGDLINGDALSRWDDLVLCTPLYQELDYAEAFLNKLSDYFDTIYFIRGNHEDRLLKSLRGQLHADQFRRMIADNARVQFSMYSYLTVVSGGVAYRVTHQVNYSQNALTVAKKLAGKFSSNIISAHQHHSAVGRDPSNSFTVIDSGGLHNSDLMAYVKLDDSTAPVMTQGFVLLKNGVATLFTPPAYNQLDWNLWLT